MDGLLFYWISWMIWIIVTFLMPKNKYRNYLAMAILMVIFCSNAVILVNNVEVYLTIAILYFGSIVAIVNCQNIVKSISKAICIVFGYVGLLFWEQISPIWIVIPRTILIPLIGFVLLIILSDSFQERCVLWCLGLTSGEIIHGLILNSYKLSEGIGEMAFMDVLIVEIGFLITTTSLLKLKRKIDLFVRSIEEQKKKVNT